MAQQFGPVWLAWAWAAIVILSVVAAARGTAHPAATEPHERADAQAEDMALEGADWQPDRSSG